MWTILFGFLVLCGLVLSVLVPTTHLDPVCPCPHPDAPPQLTFTLTLTLFYPQPHPLPLNLPLAFTIPRYQPWPAPQRPLPFGWPRSRELPPSSRFVSSLLRSCFFFLEVLLPCKGKNKSDEISSEGEERKRT